MYLEIPLVTTEDFDIDAGAQLIAAVAAVGPLNLAEVLLLTGSTPLVRETPYATAFGRAATYDGAAEKVVTWSAATEDDDGNLEFQGVCPEFRPTGDTTGNLIKGIMLQNGAGTKAYAYANIAGDGLPMENALDNVRVFVCLRPSGGSVVRIIS